MARSRSSDPRSSYDAAQEVETSGVASAQRDTCLAAVRKEPGKTAAEIARVTGLERHAPSRRLPELREFGLVENGDLRPCRATGRKSLTWFPAKAVTA